MKNKEMLRKIYYENKAINRNMQSIVAQLSRQKSKIFIMN